MTRDSQLLHRLSDGLAELYLPDGGDFPSRVISLVSSLVPAESCSYNHLVGPVAVAWRIEPADSLDFPDADQLFREHLPEHPLLRHYEMTGDLAARRISDVTSDRQFRGLGLYREFYRPARVDHQLVVSIPAPHGGMISVALNRHGRDFPDQQRDVIDLLRPHLSPGGRHCQPAEPAGARYTARRRRPAAADLTPDPYPAARRGREL